MPLSLFVKEAKNGEKVLEIREGRLAFCDSKEKERETGKGEDDAAQMDALNGQSDETVVRPPCRECPSFVVENGGIEQFELRLRATASTLNSAVAEL